MIIAIGGMERCDRGEGTKPKQENPVGARGIVNNRDLCALLQVIIGSASMWRIKNGNKGSFQVV